jgi:hypothetical protein
LLGPRPFLYNVGESNARTEWVSPHERLWTTFMVYTSHISNFILLGHGKEPICSHSPGQNPSVL